MTTKNKKFKDSLEQITRKVEFIDFNKVPLRQAKRFNIDVNAVKEYNQEIKNLNKYVFGNRRKKVWNGIKTSIAGATYAVAYGMLINDLPTTEEVQTINMFTSIIAGGAIVYGFAKGFIESQRPPIEKNRLASDKYILSEINNRAKSIQKIGLPLYGNMQSIGASFEGNLSRTNQITNNHKTITKTLEYNNQKIDSLTGKIEQHKRLKR